jgi:hypothetical protein
MLRLEQTVAFCHHRPIAPCLHQNLFKRVQPRLKYKDWAIAHRLCRLIWKILHQGVRYEERGPAVSAKSQHARLAKNGPRTEEGRIPSDDTGTANRKKRLNSTASKGVFDPAHIPFPTRNALAKSTDSALYGHMVHYAAR